MVRRLSRRKTITIPELVLKHIGVQPGDFLEITDDGERIILSPKIIEDRFTEEEWGKLEKLAKNKGKIYKGAAEAKKHLRRMA